MSVCLDYQSVYYRRQTFAVSLRFQILAAVLLLVALIGKVWMKIETTELGYKLAEEKKRTVELDMERRELGLQLSVLLRPDNLGRVAHDRLGLAPLNPNHARKVK